ncbi:hypothetical protein GGQ73_003219 [Rhizobium skierniewicense]|uniref:Uncharacterized protein n=1 Tax=Rhizobium skierniewicense TaxID=984260 RepID=A0A7W6G2M5_9HYPH|nr:hypothetical protein [Rhizobium skierniewicense]MBB3947253.1 hypothetical protein [Rhizobium skierniewicense]
MTKRRDPLTKDLFEWTPPQVAIRYEEGVTGRGPLDNRISRLIARALRDARDDGKSRVEIVEAMSRYLGRSISAGMLDKWASEASGEHRIPLDAFIALVFATGAKELLGFVPGEFGLTVIEEEYAEMVEDQLIDDHIKEMEALRASRAARKRARR